MQSMCPCSTAQYHKFGCARVQELSRLEELLRRPDFLLEPSCFSVICAYIRAGGTPETIIENLTDGYVGE